MTESLIDQRFNLEDLLDLPILREIADAFVSCFTIGINIVDDSDKEIIRQGTACQFCKLVRDCLGEEAKCDEVKKKIFQHPITGSSAIQVQAFCGLKYAAFPMAYQFDIVGRVILGPFRDEELNRNRLPTLLNVKDQEKLYSSVKSVPMISQAHLKNVTRFMAKIMDSFIFINAKRLVTTHMHLESIMQAREHVFEQIEKESTGSDEAKRNLDKLKQLF